MKPALTASDVTVQQAIDLVLLEARLLDEARYDEWNALFTDDGIYWVPLTPDQPEGLDHTSHLYEDKLLRDLRVQRLKSPRAFSQQPKSRGHHLLQMPSIEAFEPAGNRFVTRCQFHYTEAQNDEINFFVGTVFHHLCVHDGALRITLKRVNLLNSDAALPAVQLFI